MPNNFELDAEFSAIMAATRSGAAPHRPANTIPLNTSGNSRMSPPGDGYGPSRVRSRNIESVLLQPNIQAVCIPSFQPLHETKLRRAKKYDTIVKGFKILEASYEQSQSNLAITEERLSAINAEHSALIAEMETAKQILHDRETV